MKVDNPLFDYEAAVNRQPLHLPGGATVAAWVGVNIEHYEFGRPALSLVPAFEHLVPDPLNYGWRDYGPRVGIWRLMELFESLGIRATAIVNSEVVDRYPDIVRELCRLNWGIVAHGRDNSTLQATLGVEEERAYIAEVTEKLAMATGRRPRGWLGPARSSSMATNDLLAQAGYTHAMDWGNDDQPYQYRVEIGRLVSVPYSIEVNDILVYGFQGQTGGEFERRIVDQFDVLREEGHRGGRVMGVSVHPFLSGQSFRIKYLRQALEYLLRYDEVWWATSEDIADWYLREIGGRGANEGGCW